MSHALLLEHDPAFGPGRLTGVLRDFGIPCQRVRLHAGEEVPRDLDEVRVLVLLGGTQRITGEGDEYSGSLDSLDAELYAIGQFIEQDRPLLGFGLGGQLIARAGGAEVSPLKDDEGHPASHRGWSEVTLPFPGGTDPILFGMGDGTPMFFWQSDRFELPKLPPPPGHDPDKPGPPPPTGNALLCSTAWEKNAAFRFKNRAYAFAFHPELTGIELDQIERKHGGAIGAAHGSKQRDRFADESRRHTNRADRIGDRILRNYVQFLKAYDPAQ